MNDDDDWSAAVRHWVSLVDQERDVRGLPRHSLTVSARLFGDDDDDDLLRALRRRLRRAEQHRRRRARRRCVFPSCTRPPRRCDIHHLQPKSRGGPTRTSHGVLLCRFHHRLLHHGWQLTRADGHWTATDPHGTRWTGRPTCGDPP